MISGHGALFGKELWIAWFAMEQAGQAEQGRGAEGVMVLMDCRETRWVRKVVWIEGWLHIGGDTNG